MAHEYTRRALLRAGPPAAATAALMAGALDRALATPAGKGSGTLMDVDHIVILMQENRSFDHYFGTLAGVRGFADPHPAVLPDGQPVWRQPDGQGGVVAPFRFDVQNSTFPIMRSLDHSWRTGHAAWNQGRYDGWVAAKGGLTMGYLTREDIPYHHALADAFTVCDGYFASLQGPTCPNRLYLTTGSVDHHGRGGGPVTANVDITQRPDGVVFGRAWRTYSELLQEAGVSWRAYRQGEDAASDTDSDGGMNTHLAFAAFRDARPGDPLHDRGVAPRRLEQLKADVAAGELAQVSWIYPPRLFCEHPNWPPAYGAAYIARVLDALTTNPEVWSRTVFLVMYDENDGFFDHVPPPTPPLTRDQGLSTVPVDDERHPATGQPYGLGMRVPMLAMSPWSRGGWVCSEVFDHTSVIRFIERRFGVACPHISAWRRAVCGDLTSAFDFKQGQPGRPPGLPRTPVEAPLPDQARFRAFKASFDGKPAPVAERDAAAPPVEAGSRPLRPLGYDLAANARTAPDGAMEVVFRNDGRLGAAFIVIDRNQPDRPPRRYTVEAGKTLADRWTARSNSHHLIVHGPAGFLRAFEGLGDGVLDFVMTCTGSGDAILTAVNHGVERRGLTVRDGYTGAMLKLHAPPGGRGRRRFDLAKTAGWYDLTVAAQDQTHRFCGLARTDHAAVTDPALLRFRPL